jgi:protein-S-isoprenylcysteine O-methyltransferase Ste14
MVEQRAVGLSRLVHDLRHRRERFRQVLGIAFVIVVAAAASTTQTLVLAGLPLVVMGVLIRLWASGHVKKDKELATDGPYAFVRHPLYVGNILIGLGFCVASGRWWSFPVFLLFLLAFYPPAIRQEDGKLSRLFPEAWHPWAREVRALIPRLRPYRAGPSGGGWSFQQSLRQNGEPIIAVFLLALVWLAWYVGA